jgi:hypothetical protein
MKWLFTLLFLVPGALAISQPSFQKVDREMVKGMVEDTSAATYYPKLLTRFNSFDSSLSGQQYRLLYFGFVFQSGYEGDQDDKRTAIQAALTNKDYELAERICDSVLAGDPVSLSANYQMALTLYLKDRQDPAYRKYGNRYKHLLDAIVSSGDGLSCNTSFKTICVHDEYEVMYNYYSINEISGQRLSYPCDIISITPSVSFPSKEMYFDTSESMMIMDQIMSGKHGKKRH